MVGNDMEFPIFNGNCSEDQEKQLFLCEVLWNVKKFQDNNVKREQLITTLYGRVLDQFMKNFNVLVRMPQKTLAKIKVVLKDKFRNSKSKAQYITKLKDIKKFPTEYVWDFN